MDLCQQSNVSAFEYAVFSSKEQASFNFMAALTICSDSGAQENEVCHCFHCFPIYLPWSVETRCHDLCFWMLNFKPALSLSSFTIKRLFSSSMLSAIRVVSFAYLRLLIFLLATLIPACASSSLVFCMMYSASKLKKEGDSIQPRSPPLGSLIRESTRTHSTTCHCCLFSN